MPGDYVENPERKSAPPSYDKTVNDTINNVTKKMLNEKTLLIVNLIKSYFVI